MGKEKVKEDLNKQFIDLLRALFVRGIGVIGINNYIISIKLGSGVYLSHKTIRKRIKRDDGIKYERKVNPNKFKFIVESSNGLIVYLKPSTELIKSSVLLDY